MPNDFSKLPLSASTTGKGIPVVAVASPGTTIHAAGAGVVNLDEIWIWAQNTASEAVKLTLQWGGVATGDLIEITLAAESGLVLIAPGLLLQNSLEIKAFASIASMINVFGFVNRITVT